MKEKIPVVAFEGVNRAGKGTQIEKLKSTLAELDLSFVELRGDGTRDGAGMHDGDPLSPWWQEYSKKIREGGTTSEWHYAAYLLAKDVKTWKEHGAKLGRDIALLDRSLISRAAFVLDRERPANDVLVMEHLYPIQPGPKLKIEDVLPDVIFELVAEQDELINRLDKKDPKYEFRKRLIDEMYHTYYSAKDRLPALVRERIITINSNQTPDKVFDDVLETLNSRMEWWRNRTTSTS
jgi:thymidylate kinase